MGGLKITGGVTLNNNGLVVTDGGITVSTGGLYVLQSGAIFTGGLTIQSGYMNYNLLNIYLYAFPPFNNVILISKLFI